MSRPSRMVFSDRSDAGRRLARLLEGRYGGRAVVVLGLPRGGVPVAYEVAQVLDAPLDVIGVRKLGVPHRPELAMGAVGEGGAPVLNQSVLDEFEVDDGELSAVEEYERGVLERRTRTYRGGHERVPLAGALAVVVDDGIATGSTARAACRTARALGADEVVVAVPVAPAVAADGLRTVADEVVCVEAPDAFLAISQFYDDFSATTDDEVVDLLDRATGRLRDVTSGHG